MSTMKRIALTSVAGLGLLGAAWFRAHGEVPAPPRSTPVATTVVQAHEWVPPALPVPCEVQGLATAPARADGATTPPISHDGKLEGRETTELLDALTHEAGGARPRKLEYARGVLLDYLVANPVAIDEVLARIASAVDKDEIGALMQVVEEYAVSGDETLRLRLEGWSLDATSRETQPDRRNAALHYLLTAAESGALSDATIEALRPMAERDGSGLVRAGAMWLVTAREEQAPRDARLLEAIRADSDATVRETAAEGIGVLGSGPIPRDAADRAVTLLAAEAEPAVRSRLLASIAQRGVEDPTTTVRRLGGMAQAEPDVEVRRGYVSALAMIGGTEALPWLEAMRSDPAVGEEVRAYLEYLSAPAIADDPHSHE